MGASQSGTTSLWHYLRQQPSIFMPEAKESSFFSDIKPDLESPQGKRINKICIKTLEEYKQLFVNVKKANYR